MILVYSSQITPRLSYSTQLIFGELLGVDAMVTSNLETYLSHEGPKLLYAKEPLLQSGIFLQSNPLLFEQGIRPFEPDFVRVDDLPCLFPSTHPQCAMGFDLFAAAFYLVSRYEEYLPHPKDKHGRFMPENSFAVRKGFLGMPVVNRYALKIKELLSKVYPDWNVPGRSYQFVPTYDIDVAYAYKGRSFFRSLGAAFKSVLHPSLGSITERIKVLVGQSPDPFDTYSLQYLLHSRYHIKPLYFFLCAAPGAYDHNISTSSAAFKKLVLWAASCGEVGIHPSYHSDSKPTRLKNELKRLSKIVSKDVKNSRQHFLRLEMPHTYRNLIAMGITRDYTMGYASMPGFRASIASPFRFYDLLKEEATLLWVYPTAVMDGTLRDYLNLKPDEAIGIIQQIVSEVKQVNGTFISLWHNDSLSERGRWVGWLGVYEALLQIASINNESDD